MPRTPLTTAVRIGAFARHKVHNSSSVNIGPLSHNFATSPVHIRENLFVNDDCVRAALDHLPGDSVDLIVTDPPYGIQGDRIHRHYNRDEGFVAGAYVEVNSGQYGDFSRNWIAQAERVLRPGGQIYIVSGYTNLGMILTALRNTTLRETNHIIWKYNFGVYTSAKFVSSHYHILYYAKPGGKRTFNLEARFSTDEAAPAGGSANYRDREDVWIINREYKPGQPKNKNELPRALLRKMLAYSSNEGDHVCDFFMGGGSTAAVAIGMNRRFTGFEISPETFDYCVPLLRGVVAGALLDHAARPQAVAARNRGKPWPLTDIDRAKRRYVELRAEGASKRVAVKTVAEEFERGPWGVAKILAD